MRTRHRIPTIFNLSMVDVLCCALGCVILLWLLNVREAKQRATAAGQTGSLLVQTRSRLDESLRETADAQARLRDSEQHVRDLAALLRNLQNDRDQAYVQADAVAKERNLARAQLADLTRQSEAAQAKKTQEHLELTRKLTAAEKRLGTLEAMAREKDTLVTTTAKAADDLAGQLREAEARLKQLRSLADLVPGLRAEAKTNRDKLSLAESRMALLEKDVNDRKKDLGDASRGSQAMGKELSLLQRRVEELQDEKKTLAAAAAQAREAADNRFAGISLTGRRVVFLIDMSGSMDYVDERTPAPDKWAGVRETLAKIMRSLPDLEQFQVILFESRTSYLLGYEDRWLDYDPKTSLDRVGRAMAAVKPRGNTNMYAAFETAFRYRDRGLDTIYVLSDGLPNVGEGLTLEVAKNLKEFERSEILSKHVRKMLRTDWNRLLASKPRVRIHTIGFFYESPDVGAFLWALARENDGSFVGMSKP